MNNEVILYKDGELELPVEVAPDRETVWLNRNQLAVLFDRDVKTIGKHINNALKEELDSSVVAKFATTASDGKTYKVDYYNLDMIISVGYRVKSQDKSNKKLSYGIKKFDNLKKLIQLRIS